MKIIRWLLGSIVLIIDYLTSPKKIKRTAIEQIELDKLFENYSIYQFHACPFCVKLRRFLKKNSINMLYKDAKNNMIYREELKNYGGKIQVPCLRINNQNNSDKWLYESADIIEYFENIILNYYKK